MSKTTLAHLAVLGANIIYGANYNIAKLPMDGGYVLPKGFIVLRVLGALSLFWLVRLFMKKQKIEKKDLIRLAFCGLFGVCMNQMLFFSGLSMTSEINASIMMTSNPIIVLIIAALVIGEKITPLKIIGIIIGAIGAIMIIRSGTSTRDSSIYGDVLILLNSASYGVYLVLVKPLMKKYNPIVIISWVFLFGSLFVVPFGLSDLGETNWDMPPSIWASVIFVVVATTFFAYLLNIFALNELNTSTVSSYIYLQPVLATIFALIISYEEKVGGLSWEKAGYALLIFVGVYLVSKREKKTIQSVS